MDLEAPSKTGKSLIRLLPQFQVTVNFEKEKQGCVSIDVDEF